MENLSGEIWDTNLELETDLFLRLHNWFCAWATGWEMVEIATRILGWEAMFRLWGEQIVTRIWMGNCVGKLV